MITICPLDSPQLSTTLEEESHCDPTSSEAMVWCGTVAPRETLSVAPTASPACPSPAALGAEGGPLAWGGGLEFTGRAAPEVPERPAKPKALYNTGLFLERTLTFGARRPSFKLKKARKHGRALSPGSLGSTALRPWGRAAGARDGPGPGRPAQTAEPGAREGVARGTARPGPARPARLGRKAGRLARAPHDCELTRQRASPVAPRAAAGRAARRVGLPGPGAT